MYLYSGYKCSAIPNQGFEFVNWSENFSNNSSQIIQSSPSSPFYEPFLNFFHPNTVEPEAIIDITKIGSWLTPTLIDWRKSRIQGKKLEHYHNKIKDLLGDDRLD